MTQPGTLVSNRRVILAGVAVLILIVGAGGVWLRFGNQDQVSNDDERPRLSELIPEREPVAESSPTEDLTTSTSREAWANGKYVGVDICRECHEERVDDFVHTSHFRTSRLPDAETLQQQLAQATSQLATRNADLHFELAVQNQTLTQTAVTVREGAEERETRDVGIVYGAGDFDEDYLHWQGDKLFQLPVVYLHNLQQWSNAPGFMDGEVNFDRPIPPRCLECHTTFFDYKTGTTNAFHPENYLLGISCERCHGPGEKHVEFHRQFPDQSEPRFVYQPAEMTREQRLDLCAQCHSNANKRKTAPFSYRPGEPLDDHFRIDQNNHPEEDHTSNQHRYIQESKCFQASSTMTCVTCHDPHLPRELAREASRESCAQCHQPVDCGEHDQLPLEVREQCIDCHMPPRYVNNITFDQADDQYVPIIVRHEHRVAVYEDATQLQLLKWHQARDDEASQANAESLKQTLVANKKLEAETLAQDFRYLASAGAYREALRLGEDEELRQRMSEMLEQRRRIDLSMRTALQKVAAQQLDEAIEQLQQVLSDKPTHAAAHGKLGLLLAETGKIEEGIGHLKKVAELDPDNGYGYALLGYIYLVKSDFAQAEKYYLLAESLEPYSAKIKSYLGRIAAQSGNLTRAEQYWRQALEIEPQNREVLFAVISMFLERGRTPDALMLTERCAELTDRADPSVLDVLAGLYEQVGRVDEAIKALEDAQAAVGDDQPQVKQALEQHLRQLKQRP